MGTHTGGSEPPPPEDPWIYSVDQVIACLKPFINDDEVSSFRDNDITGQVLLITASFETLKNELRIFSLGKRTAIMGIVVRWRARSEGYRDFHREGHLRALGIQHSEDSLDVEEYPLVFPTHLPGLTTAPAAIAENEMPTMIPEIPNLTTAPAAIAENSMPNIIPETPDHSNLLLRDEPLYLTNPLSSGASLVEIRSDVPMEACDVAMPLIEPVLDACGDMEPEIDTETRKMERVSERIAKEDIAMDMDISDAKNDADIEISLKKETSGTKKPYLPPKSRKIDTLFYGVEVGEDIYVDLEDDEDKFCFTSVRRARFPGEQRYVVGRMRHFLSGRRQSVWTQNNSRLTAGFRHYDHDRYFRKGVHPSFTVYDVYSSTRSRVHRETSATLLLPWGDLGTARPSDTQIVRHNGVSQDPIDLLLKWQNIDGATDELPGFGESDDEDEDDRQSASREIEEEGGSHGEVARRSVISLTGEEIEETINEVIRKLVQEWRSRIMPKKEATKAYSLWRRAQKERRRKRTAHQARIRVEELDQRLLKLRSEFFKNGVVWRTKNQISKQARGSMEVTVREREEGKWLAELMERSEQPAKPERKPTRTKDGEELSETDDGEDVASSSSDEFYSADEEDVNLDGFLVSDDEGDLRGGVEIEVVGEREVEEELAQRHLDLGFNLDDDDDEEIQDAKDLPVTASQSTPAEYVDLTEESSSHETRREPVIINLLDDDDEMTEAAPPQNPPRDKLYQYLQGLTGDQRFGLYWKLYDIRDESNEVWFSLLIDCVHDLKRGRKTKGLKEQLAVCPIYVAWALDLPQRPNFSHLTAQHVKKLEEFRLFKAFASAVCNILGQDPKIVDSTVAARNSRLQFMSDDREVFDDAAYFDDEADVNNGPRHRKRKHKEIAEDQEGKARRGANEKFNKNLARRIAEQRKRAQADGVEVGGGGVVINLGHYAQDRDILIIDEIASKLKNHQIEGVRFMWQQLVQSGQNRGALLAHTMGLGKTLQV
jgi:hypothetical protein